MNETKELKTYICQFCKQSYQSDGERKPELFRRDGSIFRSYDSSKFCSKECCRNNRIKNHKLTLSNNPEIKRKNVYNRKRTLQEHSEILKKSVEKRLQTYKNNPEIQKQSTERYKQTLKNHPEIKVRRLNAFRQTLKNNPEIMKERTKKRLETLKNNPNILKRSIEKYKQTLKNNPEIIIKAQEKHKQTLKDNPNIIKNQVEKFKITIKNNSNIIKQRTDKYKQTIRNDPNIIKKQKEKHKQTLKDNPDIIKKQQEKRLETLKNNPNILKRSIEKYKQTLKNNPEIRRKAAEKRRQTLKDNQTYLNKFKKQHSNYFELFKSYEDVLNYIKNNNIKTLRELAQKLNINPCALKSHLSQDFELDEQFDKLLDGSISSYEKEITNFLDQLDVKYEFHNRTVLNGREIDIYISDYKIGIEFNGDLYHGEYFYWGNELKYNKEPNYHRMKSKLAEEKGIFLFHIFEYEYVQKRDIFLSIIRNLLNKNESKIPARKCIVKEIDSKTTDEFLNNNHLQGSDSSSIRYGLFYENQLVSVMTFCKPRFNKKYNYELSRFCSLRGYTIVGGANKLFKHFIRNNPNKSIISYSNIAHTKGGVYEKLRFKLYSISNPNYIWFKYKRTEENKNLFDILSRYQTQKHKLIKQNLGKYGNTENEIMSNLGYYRIFDCGNKVWTYPI